ncbi:hypothetical protein K438DRAFT_1752985 [Mycena galopus ATCC 62051]|nr:hypothetical protein K438DRAFT_1752985 [Mycena galopus ATCC 62051]
MGGSEKMICLDMIELTPMPWVLLKSDSREAWQCEAECQQSRLAFTQRDRTKIKSYGQLLRVRGRRDARIACARAIATRCTVLGTPWHFEDWQQQFIPPVPQLPSPPTPAPAAPTTSSGWGSSQTFDGGWDDDGWAHPASWADWAVASWATHTQGVDQQWDGTRVPKSTSNRQRKLERKLVKRGLAAGAKVGLAARTQQLLAEARVEWDRRMEREPTMACC